MTRKNTAFTIDVSLSDWLRDLLERAFCRSTRAVRIEMRVGKPQPRGSVPDWKGLKTMALLKLKAGERAPFKATPVTDAGTATRLDGAAVAALAVGSGFVVEEVASDGLTGFVRRTDAAVDGDADTLTVTGDADRTSDTRMIVGVLSLFADGPEAVGFEIEAGAPEQVPAAV